jgi:hypothetical protein
MKRPTLKGMGAKLFESGQDAGIPSQRHDGTMSHQQNGEDSQNPKYPKATFYLPTDMLERLDKAWIARRNRDRRVKKSDLVREALETYLADQERRRYRTAD